MKPSQIKAKQEATRKLLTKVAEMSVNTNDPVIHQCRIDFMNIVTLLRGPDSDDEQLKLFTVSRVRAIVGISPQRYKVTTIPLTPEEMVTRDALLRSAGFHFRWHYTEAVAAVINLYGYNLRTETKVE